MGDNLRGYPGCDMTHLFLALAHHSEISCVPSIYNGKKVSSHP